MSKVLKATELRIGNYFDNYGNIDTITPNELEALFESEDRQWIKPILLTEEWLLKFGFAKIDHIAGYSFFSLKKKRGDNKPSISIFKTYTSIGNNSSTKHCEYIHQLQNLYFALTEEELTEI